MAEKDDSLSLADRDSLAVEALLDEELTIRDADALRRRIVSNDRLTLEFESQRFLRQEFRSWFIDSADLGTRQVDVWSHVARRIELEQRQSGWRSRLDRALDFVRSPGPSKGAFAALAACLALTLTAQFTGQFTGPKSSTNNVSPVVASSDGQFGRESSFETRQIPASTFLASQAPDSQAPDALVRNVSFGNNNSSHGPGAEIRGMNPIGMQSAPQHGFGFQFFVRRTRGGVARPATAGAPNSAAFNAGSSAFGAGSANVPVAASAGYLENHRNFLRSGMKTPGADIEWIRSDRGFKIVPAKSDKAPPVIWVGKDEDLH